MLTGTCGLVNATCRMPHAVSVQGVHLKLTVTYGLMFPSFKISYGVSTPQKQVLTPGFDSWQKS